MWIYAKGRLKQRPLPSIPILVQVADGEQCAGDEAKVLDSKPIQATLLIIRLEGNTEV